MFNTEDYTLRNVPIRFGSVTLMGILADEYPVSHGNYFSLMIDDKPFQVLNFYYENLKELESQGLTDISVLILESGYLFIHDERISENWYSNFSWRKPRKYWSPSEVLKEERMVKSGKKEVFKVKTSNGTFIQGEKVNMEHKSKYPKQN